LWARSPKNKSKNLGGEEKGLHLAGERRGNKPKREVHVQVP